MRIGASVVIAGLTWTLATGTGVVVTCMAWTLAIGARAGAWVMSGRSRLMPFTLRLPKCPSDNCNPADQGKDACPTAVNGAEQPFLDHRHSSVIEEEGGCCAEHSGQKRVALCLEGGEVEEARAGGMWRDHKNVIFPIRKAS